MTNKAHRHVLLTYLAVMGLATTTLGGYVACGAQTYRVRVDNDVEFKSNTSLGESNLFGVHSAKGWTNRLPIHFKTTDSMSTEMVTELKTAMATWEAAIGKQLFTYDGTEAKHGPDFAELYSPLADNVNGHYLDPNWSASTKKPNTVLATTIWENDAHDARYITKADIRYNTETYILGNTLTEFSQGDRTIVDLQSLALHELGHLLGLSHISTEQDRYSVMNPALFIGEGMITRKLSKGDLERIRSIYGVGDASKADALDYADNSK